MKNVGKSVRCENAQERIDIPQSSAEYLFFNSLITECLLKPAIFSVRGTIENFPPPILNFANTSVEWSYGTVI